MIENAKTWSTRQATDEFIKIAKEQKRPEITRNCSTFNKKWDAAVEQMLAICESEDIEPQVFIRSVIETVGFFCQQKRMPLMPAMIVGPGAAERYNRWLARRRSTTGRAEISIHDSPQYLAELSYVRTCVKRHDLSCQKRKRLAKIRAEKIVPVYTPSAPHRLMALSAVLHELNPDLPDQLCLPRRWLLHRTIRAALRLAGRE